MVITEAQLRRQIPNINNESLSLFVGVFNEWSDRFGINTKKRVVHFLSQVMHESSALNRLEENLRYSADGLLRTFPKYFNTYNVSEYAYKPEKIANRVYANRLGNGNEQSFDGWQYRGRGCIQITGKANYKAYANSGFCNGDLVGHPEWLTKYPGALKSAMWFWYKNGCNEIADKDNWQRVIDGEQVVTTITKRINGGLNGIAERKFFYRRLRKEFI